MSFISGSVLLILSGCSAGLIENDLNLQETSETTTETVETAVTTSTTSETTSTSTSTTTSSTEPTYPEYDTALLRIIAPTSGAFLPYGEQHSFEAEVVDQYDNPMDFEEIVWTSSAASDWEVTGAEVLDGSLDVGRHDITATAELPNGDRLAYTVGGVLLQSVYAGTYSGLFSSNLGYSGYTLGCAGAATLMVDAYGETVSGDAACIVTLGSFDLDLTYNFDLSNDEGALSGIMNVELLGFIEIPVDIEGTVSDEGVLDLNWYDDSSEATTEGEITLERVSLDAGL